MRSRLRIEEYTTLELIIPPYGVANQDRYRQELQEFRPLLTLEGYARIFHPEIRDLAKKYPNLSELYINRCGLQVVPQLPNRWLTRLWINHNHITHLPDDLPDTITILFIYDTDLRELPKRLPKNLKYMNVCCNPQLRLARDYRFPVGLQDFICNDCQLLELPDTLPHTLKRLLCDSNQLKELPQILPRELEVLTCCWNDIARLPRLPNKLVTLDCANNPRIKWLPELPPSFENLRVDYGIYKPYSGFIQREQLQDIHNYFCTIQENTREKMNVVGRQLERVADLMPEFLAARDRIMLNPRRIHRLISTEEMDMNLVGMTRYVN